MCSLCIWRCFLLYQSDYTRRCYNETCYWIEPRQRGTQVSFKGTDREIFHIKSSPRQPRFIDLHSQSCASLAIFTPCSRSFPFSIKKLSSQLEYCFRQEKDRQQGLPTLHGKLQNVGLPQILSSCRNFCYSIRKNVLYMLQIFPFPTLCSVQQSLCSLHFERSKFRPCCLTQLAIWCLPCNTAHVKYGLILATKTTGKW